MCSLLYNKGTLDASRKLAQTGEPTHLLYDECLQLFQSAHLATARLPPGFKYSDPYVGGLCLSPRLGSIGPTCTFTVKSRNDNAVPGARAGYLMSKMTWNSEVFSVTSCRLLLVGFSALYWEPSGEVSRPR